MIKHDIFIALFFLIAFYFVLNFKIVITHNILKFKSPFKIKTYIFQQYQSKKLNLIIPIFKYF